MRLPYLLIVFIFLQIHLDLPSRQKTYLKIKVFNKIQFFTLEFIHTCDNLISFCFNYFCKFHSQQTFVVLKTSSTHLQRNNFTSSKTSWKHLTRRFEDVLDNEKLLRWRRLEDVLKTCLEDVLKKCLEDVLKTCIEDVLKTIWTETKYLLEI